MKISQFVFALFCIVVGASGTQSQIVPSSTKEHQEPEILENWKKDGGKSQIGSRYIFTYLAEDLFTLDRLTSIFEKYQKEFCDPYMLRIIVYSDKAMIAKRIAWGKRTVFIEFTDDEAGRKAAQKYDSSVEPPPTGYLRAEYARYGSYELFDYSLNKNSPVMTRVMLREPNIATKPNPCKSGKR